MQTLRFIRHSRDLGFSIPEIGQLVGLWQDRSRPSREVKALAKTHIRELEEKAQELLAMKAALEHLAHACRGDDRPECPIIDTLATQGVLGSSTPKHGGNGRKTGLRPKRLAATRA